MYRPIALILLSILFSQSASAESVAENGRQETEPDFYAAFAINRTYPSDVSFVFGYQFAKIARAYVGLGKTTNSYSTDLPLTGGTGIEFLAPVGPLKPVVGINLSTAPTSNPYYYFGNESPPSTWYLYAYGNVGLELSFRGLDPFLDSFFVGAGLNIGLTPRVTGNSYPGRTREVTEYFMFGTRF